MFAHTITLCLSTMLHGQPSITCNTISLEEGRYRYTKPECIETLPEALTKWWLEAAPLLRIQPSEVRGADCQKSDDNDGDQD